MCAENGFVVIQEWTKNMPHLNFSPEFGFSNYLASYVHLPRSNNWISEELRIWVGSVCFWSRTNAFRRSSPWDLFSIVMYWCARMHVHIYKSLHKKKAHANMRTDIWEMLSLIHALLSMRLGLIILNLLWGFYGSQSRFFDTTNYSINNDSMIN